MKKQIAILLIMAGMLIGAGGCGDPYLDPSGWHKRWGDSPGVAAAKKWGSIVCKINSRDDWTWQDLELVLYEAQDAGKTYVTLNILTAYKGGTNSLFMQIARFTIQTHQKVEQLYVEAHPKISSGVKDFILYDDEGAIGRRPLFLGLTTEQVRIAMGRPKDINTTTGSWGTHEQWVYGRTLYLYFENGILTAYQH